MEFLSPIVARELRCALRQRGAVKARFHAALVGAALTTVFLLLSLLDRRGTPGFMLHEFLFLGGLYMAVVRPCQIASGLFSEERRQQTLELLCLTGMSPVELFTSKVLSGALVSSSELLAIVPYLAVPFLQGGVSFDLFVATIACLPALLVLALSISVLSSILSSDDGGALTLSIVIFAVLSLFVAAPYRLGLLLTGAPPFSTAWLSLSPAYGPYLVWSGAAEAALNSFWGSVAAALVCSLECFILAGAVLAKTWSGGPESIWSFWRDHWQVLVRGSAAMRASLRRRWLEANPFRWSVERDRHPVLMAGAVITGICLLWLFGWRAWGKFWPSTMNFFITALLLIKIIDWFMVHSAARRIGQARRDLALELLLTTPLTPEQIVDGQLSALKAQFRPLRWIVFGLSVLMLVWGFMTRSWQTEAIVSYLFIWCIFFVLCLRQPHFTLVSAMWVSLNSGRPMLALFRAGNKNGWQWIWIVFQLRNIGRTLSGGTMGRFPTGSFGELILVSVAAVLVPLFMVATASEARKMRARLVDEMRSIAQEPVPDPHDPRFKKWNPKERFGEAPVPNPSLR